MDRFQEMSVFAAVVDGGSFVKAADSLGMSKAAVSRHVAELEARLGVRLLHRTTRRLSLTEEGEVFHARCRALLADLADAEAEATAQAGEASGLLRVNVPVTFGLMHLAPLWPAFLSMHPKLAMDVTLSDRVVDLVDEGYDLAVRIGRLVPSSLVSRRLSSTRMVLCAAPSYLRVHGAPAHPSALADHAVIGYSLLASGDLWTFERAGEQVSVTVAPRLRTNSGDTCVAAAIAGQGLVLQPSFMLGAPLACGALVEVLPDWRGAEMGIHAVYPSRQHVPPKVRRLIEFLSDAFTMRAWPT